MFDTAITLDIDWAPDFTIDWVADKLIKANVRATWFVTHQSPAVERLRQNTDLFELGIHPNFLMGSTQGETPSEVLAYCMKLVPEARSMRTHGLMQSTTLLSHVMAETPIETDVSLFLPGAGNLTAIEYWWKKRRLLRIPYVWEDDFEMEFPHPNWSITSFLPFKEGLKVFDFHPIHIYLNSLNPQPYQEFKRHVPNLMEASAGQLEPYINRGKGTQTFFLELIAQLTSCQNVATIRELSHQYVLEDTL